MGDGGPVVSLHLERGGTFPLSPNAELKERELFMKE